LNNAIKPQITYGGNIYFSGLTAYQCILVNGEWEYDDSTYTTQTFGNVIGYQTSNPYANSLFYIVVHEVGNFTGRYVTFNNVTLPDSDIAVLQTNYNGNQVTDRYVEFVYPDAVSSGTFTYVGSSPNGNVMNWLTINPN
jgi:hypothetical protein